MKSTHSYSIDLATTPDATPHTPGPWEVEYDFSYGGHFIRMASAIRNPKAHKTQHVVEYDHGYYSDDPDSVEAFQEAEANAYVMAASPELLKACRTALYVLKTVRKRFEESMAIPRSNLLNKAIEEAEAAIKKAEARHD